MTRLACGLALASLALVLAMLWQTEASTAIPFTFLGHGGLGLAIGALMWDLWRPVHLSADERALHQLMFESLSPRDFAQLASKGTWRESGPGEVLLRDGEPISLVHVVASGSVSLNAQGRRIGTLGPGDMIGSSVIFNSERIHREAVTEEPTRTLSWPVTKLRKVLERKSSLRAALQAIVIEDLTSKLRSRT